MFLLLPDDTLTPVAGLPPLLSIIELLIKLNTPTYFSMPQKGRVGGILLAVCCLHLSPSLRLLNFSGRTVVIKAGWRTGDVRVLQ